DHTPPRLLDRVGTITLAREERRTAPRRRLPHPPRRRESRRSVAEPHLLDHRTRKGEPVRAKRIEKLCTIPNHIPGDIHSTQTSRLNAEVDRLKAENQALRAIIGLQADEKNETLRVLSDLAAAFQIGEAAGWPGASSTSIDAERVTGGHPSSKPPQAR